MFPTKEQTINEVLELDIIKELQRKFPNEDIQGAIRETLEIAYGSPTPASIQDGDAPKE